MSSLFSCHVFINISIIITVLKRKLIVENYAKLSRMRFRTWQKLSHHPVYSKVLHCNTTLNEDHGIVYTANDRIGERMRLNKYEGSGTSPKQASEGRTSLPTVQEERSLNRAPNLLYYSHSRPLPTTRKVRSFSSNEIPSFSRAHTDRHGCTRDLNTNNT